MYSNGICPASIQASSLFYIILNPFWLVVSTAATTRTAAAAAAAVALGTSSSAFTERLRILRALLCSKRPATATFMSVLDLAANIVEEATLFVVKVRRCCRRDSIQARFPLVALSFELCVGALKVELRARHISLRRCAMARGRTRHAWEFTLLRRGAGNRRSRPRLGDCLRSRRLWGGRMWSRSLRGRRLWGRALWSRCDRSRGLSSRMGSRKLRRLLLGLCRGSTLRLLCPWLGTHTLRSIWLGHRCTREGLTWHPWHSWHSWHARRRHVPVHSLWVAWGHVHLATIVCHLWVHGNLVGVGVVRRVCWWCVLCVSLFDGKGLSRKAAELSTQVKRSRTAVLTITSV